jgi:hypothetical protein
MQCSKWFLQKIGHEGLCRHCALFPFILLRYLFFFFFFFFFRWFFFKFMKLKNFKGLNNLLMAYDDKSAYALCAFSFALGPNAEPITFLGKTPVNPSSFMILYSDEELRCTYIYICFQQFNSNNLPIYLTMI